MLIWFSKFVTPRSYKAIHFAHEIYLDWKPLRLKQNYRCNEFYLHTRLSLYTQVITQQHIEKIQITAGLIMTSRSTGDRLCITFAGP